MRENVYLLTQLHLKMCVCVWGGGGGLEDLNHMLRQSFSTLLPGGEKRLRTKGNKNIASI